LQHGLMDSSATWVINQPSESFAFLLADAGFDVWLGNSRGNIYGQKHVSLNVSQDAFWEFSFDQMAIYDIPAKLWYVLNTTKAQKLDYIGHSEGTEIFFALFGNVSATEEKDLQPHIEHFVALAPVAYLGNIGSTLLRDAAKIPPEIVHATLGRKGCFQQYDSYVKDDVEACKALPETCIAFICSEISGCQNYSNYNRTNFDFIMGHYPAGSSVQNLLHYAQAVDHDEFQMYDYGTKGNEEHYGRKTPPLYFLSSLNVSTLIYYGGVDKLADEKDVEHLLKEIPRPVYTKFFPHYGHFDFVWGLDAHILLYPQIIQFLVQN